MKEGKLFYFKKYYKEMSTKKRIACWIVLIAIIVVIVTMCTQERGKIIFRNGKFMGITSDRVETDDKTSVFQDAAIKISSLDVHNDVDISGKITTTDGDVKFHFTGDLYVSEKQAQGIEAYVGNIVDRKNNFTVNYFEIKNDTSCDLLKYSEENLNKRIISFDLERNGINYYFELDMDALGVSFDAESITEHASREIDFYDNYVNGEKSVAPCIIPSDEEEHQMDELENTNIHSYLAVGERWYYKQVLNSWFCDEIVYEYYAEPEVQGVIMDVGMGGTSIWTSKFSFWGYVEKDGVCIENVDNVFRIGTGCGQGDDSAVPQIEFQMYLGDNTGCTSGEYQGKCRINGVEENYQHEFVSGYDEHSVVQEPLERSILLDKAGHYISFLGYVSTMDSSDVPNQQTDCLVRWSYNMYYNNKLLENGSATIEEMIGYGVNMKFADEEE